MANRALISAVLLAAVGWWLVWYFRQKDKTLRTFDHRVVSDAAILSGHQRPDYITVMAGPLELKDPRITTVMFKNTGSKPIDVSDFREPYEITREGAKLLDFHVLKESHPSLVRKLEQTPKSDDGSPRKLLVHPGMLNPGDQFTLQLLYDGGEDNWPVIVGRFFDQSRESGVIPTRSELDYAGSARISGLAMAAMFLLFGIPISFGDSQKELIVGLILVSISIGFAVSGQTLCVLRKRRLYERKQIAKPRTTLETALSLDDSF